MLQQQLKCSTAEHRKKNTWKGIKRKLHPFHPHAIPCDFHLSDEHKLRVLEKKITWNCLKNILSTFIFKSVEMCVLDAGKQ